MKDEDGRRAEGGAALRLHRLVRRAAWPGLVGTATSLLVVVVMLAYLAFVLEPRLTDLREGQKAARDASAAMLDQETGVRGYLATWDDNFLEPYRSGAEVTESTEPLMVEALSEHPRLIALAIASVTATHAWQTQWAVPAISKSAKTPNQTPMLTRLSTSRRLVSATTASMARKSGVGSG